MSLLLDACETVEDTLCAYVCGQFTCVPGLGVPDPLVPSEVSEQNGCPSEEGSRARRSTEHPENLVHVYEEL